MNKLILLLLTIFAFSCKKDKEPEPLPVCKKDLKIYVDANGLKYAYDIRKSFMLYDSRTDYNNKENALNEVLSKGDKFNFSVNGDYNAISLTLAPNDTIFFRFFGQGNDKPDWSPVNKYYTFVQSECYEEKQTFYFKP